MIFKNKAANQPELEAQAQKLGIPTAELIELGKDKSCPKYGTAELLHARRVRGGKLVVFNISEKYRGEKISEGRKKIKASKASADGATDEINKK
ncbi:MAG: hypothetical protein AABY64_14545 [Bdellovibrionota bacterium]